MRGAISIIGFTKGGLDEIHNQPRGGQPLLFKNKIWDFLGRRNPLSKMSFTNRKWNYSQQIKSTYHGGRHDTAMYVNQRVKTYLILLTTNYCNLGGSLLNLQQPFIIVHVHEMSGHFKQKDI